MSSLSNLAPLPEKKSFTNKKALDTSVDDFDALLDDMLDSPKVKRPVKVINKYNFFTFSITNHNIFHNTKL